MKKKILYICIVIVTLLGLGVFILQNKQPKNIIEEIYYETFIMNNQGNLDGFTQLNPSFDKSPLGKGKQTHKELERQINANKTITLAFTSNDNSDTPILNVIVRNKLNNNYYTITTFNYYQRSCKLTSTFSVYNINNENLNRDEVDTLFSQLHTTSEIEIKKNQAILDDYLLKPWFNNKSKFSNSNLGDIKILDTKFE